VTERLPAGMVAILGKMFGKKGISTTQILRLALEKGIAVIHVTPANHSHTRDAAALVRVLRDEVVPSYYQRDRGLTEGKMKQVPGEHQEEVAVVN